MKRDRIFSTCIVVFIVASMAFANWYFKSLPIVEVRIEDLTQLQEHQLDLYAQRVGVLLTLATLVLGAAGAILWHTWEKQSSRYMFRFAALSLVFSGLSVCFGYFAFDAAIWMLRAEFFNLGSSTVRLWSTLQIVASLTSIIMLILAFLIGPGSGEEKSK